MRRGRPCGSPGRRSAAGDPRRRPSGSPSGTGAAASGTADVERTWSGHPRAEVATRHAHEACESVRLGGADLPAEPAQAVVTPPLVVAGRVSAGKLVGQPVVD